MHKLMVKITAITSTIFWFDEVVRDFAISSILWCNVEVGDATLHTAVHRKQILTMMSSLRKSHYFHANVHSIKSHKVIFNSYGHQIQECVSAPIVQPCRKELSPLLM